MQTLPVETLSQIFRAACTDGGYTGCTLSQTSRAVRAVSQLSIGFDRLESFIILYEKVDGLVNSSLANVIPLHPKDEEEEGVASVAHGSEASSYPQPIRLLELVADDLVSLALPSMLPLSSPACDVHHTDCAFPSLPALILNVFCDTAVLATSAVSPLFPAVTHLQIVMSPHPLARAPFSGWITHAPRTTHLRISFPPLVGINQEHMRSLLRTHTRAGLHPRNQCAPGLLCVT